MPNYKILLVTPIFAGSGTGAAVYYRLLVHSLQEKGYCFTVVSETPQTPISDGNCDYLALFPRRSGKNKQILQDLCGYLWQNFLYCKLPGVIENSAPQIVLIHSSFYNIPGIFPQVMEAAIERFPSRKFIADVRDVLLPNKKVKYLKNYDRVIACSENVVNRLIGYGLEPQKIYPIPIPQEKIIIDRDKQNFLQEKLELSQTSYIFYAGMIKELKAVDLLLESFCEFVRPVLPNIVLVIAGYLKTTNQKILHWLQSEGVRYLGNLSRSEVLLLMAGAQLCINLSPHEGMPRSSLEALALKRPVLLPPNVPEFERFCPEFVVNTRNPQLIAQKIVTVLQSEKIPDYPIERHFPEQVVSQYEEVFSNC